ncbi:MAG: hypothetical protein EXQ70_03045 [Solirubrobacterales bacterium]|nr:hypothetical protein [Solirubrobacterales bacterium]
MSRAEEILAAREPIGWRLGLERMRRLCTLLGMPQHRFASIHVVGTNGKTSVTRMTAALLEAHGVAAGAYLSPHINSWRERILIRGEPIGEPAFDEAMERVEEAALIADRSAGDEGPVTQFELATAAAFWALAAAKVEVGVIEAGLGGRLDATNVIPSKLTVLTSIGLDHTDWLGETREEIAAEKLAVLRGHTTLIHGELPPEVEPVVELELTDKHALRLFARPDSAAGPAPGYPLRNWALAQAATEAMLERIDDDAVGRARRELSIPGRAERIDGDPPRILDAAHNAQGALALAQLLPELSKGRPVICCLAVLADKDAGEIVRALAPACEAFVCTEVPPEAIEGSGRPGGQSVAAADLAREVTGAGGEAEALVTPLKAWARALDLARERRGVALATGSHYLLGCLWTERHAQSS